VSAALVTGAGGGIGRAVALELAARGWKVQGSHALELAAAYGVEIPELPEDVVEVVKQGNYVTAVLPS